MLANAPVFGKLLSALGIRESVALTKVDLSRAIPVIDTAQAIRASQIERRMMVQDEVHAGIGTAILDVDPRTGGDWLAVSLNGQEFVPSVDPIAPVPADHDFLVLGMGFKRSASTVKHTLFYSFAGSTGSFLMTLAHAEDTDSSGMVFNSSGGMYDYPMPFFSLVNDPGTLRWFSDAGAAATASITLDVLSAPPGILGP